MLTAGTMVTRVTVTEFFSYVIGLAVAVAIYGQEKEELQEHNLALRANSVYKLVVNHGISHKSLYFLSPHTSLN